MDSSKIERQRVRWVGRHRIRSVTGATAVAGAVLAAALGIGFAGMPNSSSTSAGSAGSGSGSGPVAQPIAATGSSGSGLLSGWGGSWSRGRNSEGGLAPPTQPPGTSAGSASHAGSGAS